MTNKIIQNISAAEISDSRGKPTLFVTVKTEGAQGSFAVPSGASVGLYEAHELRDPDGKGVTEAKKFIETEINSLLVGMNVEEQAVIDRKMIAADGTKNKSRLGANSLIGVSVAVARAAAVANGVELYQHLQKIGNIPASGLKPRLFINLINGGKHARGGSPFQEHQIIPSVDDLSEAIEISRQVQGYLREYLEREKIAYTFGDEGGFVFPVADVLEPFRLIQEAIAATENSAKASIGADVAASSFYKDGSYEIFGEKASASDLMEIYKKLFREYNLTHLEDPFEENKFEDFARLHREIPELRIIGDDLTTTSMQRIQMAIEQKSMDAVIIKVNQIGTMTETLEAIKLARANQIRCIVSHRSGETGDDLIAEITKAFDCYGMKSGAWGQPEREVKYNRLIDLYK